MCVRGEVEMDSGRGQWQRGRVVIELTRVWIYSLDELQYGGQN